MDEKRNKKRNPECGGADVNAGGYDCNRCNISWCKSVTGEGRVCLCSVEAQKTCVAGEMVLSSGGSETCILPLCMFSAIFPVEFWAGPSHKGLGGMGGLVARVHQRRTMNSFRGCGDMYPLIECIAYR